MSIENNQAIKACPMCGESILAVAKKCKHCGSMLDKSHLQDTNVKIKGSDPFAELHSDIQSKKEGKLTFVGYLGMGLGLLIVIAALSEIKNKGAESVKFGLIGVGFIVASYLWARRK